MIWKGLGIFLGSAGFIVAGVIGLALWLVPNEPAFSEGFADASEGAHGTLDFVPTAIGGELEVTGAIRVRPTVVRGMSTRLTRSMSGGLSFH